MIDKETGYRIDWKPFSKKQEIGYAKMSALSKKYKVAVDFNRCATCNNRDYGSRVTRPKKNIIVRDCECRYCKRRVITKETIRVIRKGKK